MAFSVPVRAVHPQRLAANDAVNDNVGKNSLVVLEFANGYTIARHRKHKSHGNCVVISLCGELPQLDVSAAARPGRGVAWAIDAGSVRASRLLLRDVDKDVNEMESKLEGLLRIMEYIERRLEDLDRTQERLKEGAEESVVSLEATMQAHAAAELNRLTRTFQRRVQTVWTRTSRVRRHCRSRAADLGRKSGSPGLAETGQVR
ncbi:hypothetical protein B0J13DRAFT_607203 [Dactylonectria estremocensis]|uniref:Uncharacterized protein n=1 Tax=Dactylonectria estremocensis TaxID=1079267 RepID=A0A9P9ERA1_9HYPO|nr:hypothetical protein B0J13DRAFT_607203 [Dactylonectria estremocensis]